MKSPKKVLSILFYSFIVCAIAIAAPRGEQNLVPSGHWVYDALTQLEMECGRYHFIDQAPLSIEQIKASMNDIVYDVLSDVGKIQYQRILDYFEEENWSLNAGIFSLGTEIDVNLEGYVKTSDQIDWIYGYHDRKPFLNMPFKLDLGNYLTAFMGLRAGQNRTIMEKHENYVNHVFTPDAFDPFLVRDTYLSTGHVFDSDVGFNFRIGMGNQSIGRTILGSSILSDYMPDAGYAQFSVFSPVFNYVMNITQLNRDTYMYTHRLEARFFKKFTFSILEGVLPYSAFDLRFLNPLGIYHGFALFEEYNLTSYFALKINFVPIKNLRIYGLYVQDEHQLASEKSSGADYVPEAMGFQGGVEVNVPTETGYFRFSAEGYYSSPFMYIKESPNWTFVKTSREMVDGTADTYDWIGSPLGPDSVGAKFTAGYEKPGKWSLDFSYLFGARGEYSSKDIFTSIGWNSTTASASKFGNTQNPAGWIYPTGNNPGAKDYKAPHGIPEYCHSFSLKGMWNANRWMTLAAQPSYTFVFNRGHKDSSFAQGFEVALSCRMSLNKLFVNVPSCYFITHDRLDAESASEEVK